MKKIYLYGAGGHAKVIVDILKEQGVSVPHIIDDNKALNELIGIPIVHNTVSSPLIVSIGNNIIRKKVIDHQKEVIYGQALALSAVISDSVSIGEGSVVMQGAIIQSSVQIGNHVIVNTGATIDHDCTIHDYAHIAPGCNLCGNVEIGEGTLIGAGTTIIPGVKIGKWCVVGAGSVVLKDIPDYVMAAGSPSKILKNIQTNGK